MKRKVSDLIRDFLEAKGVKHVFLLSGGMMMHLLDSVSKSKTIQYVCHHHEQAATMAAEGYARRTGSLGVCYATSGPGATNTVTGIAGAWLDSSPIMVLTGQSRKTLTARGLERPEMRMVGNFEVDIVNIVKHITKYAAFVDTPREILFHLEKAYYLALNGRPGPVLLDIPLDVQGAWVEESELEHFTPPVPLPPPSDTDIAAILSHLKKAARPLIFAGHGVRASGSAEAFRLLIKTLGVPVVTTQLANDLMPYHDDLYVGHIGLRGDRGGNFAVQACDFLLCLGTSMHVTSTGYELDSFAPKATKAIVDIDTAQLDYNPVQAAIRIHADTSVFIKLLAAKVNTPDELTSHAVWVKKCRLWKQTFQIANEPHLAQGDEINTYKLIDTMSDVLHGNETIVTDAGSLYYIVGQAFRAKANQRVIVSGAFGAMGYALPAAIGASFSEPDKPVICITGDGSLHMNVQELATLAHNRTNCKIIFINNGGYASIRNTQNAFCDGHLAGSSNSSGVSFPEWEKIAQAYGIPYLRENKQSRLKNLIQSLLSTSTPVICEIVTPETVTMLPAVTSEKLPNGSFKSNKLHEMSPQLTKDQLEKAGVDL